MKDFQTWSGITKLRDIFERLRPQLVMFQNQQGEELFDLPHAPRPEAEIEAAPRFLGEFDHVLLSHDNRTRIMDENDRRRIITNNGIVKATILVDGFVAGGWTIVQQGNTAVLNIESFRALTLEQADQLVTEGERLLRYAVAEGDKYDITFTYSTNI
jgi:sulfur transfer complex TusBCD TusB component (DsrH family)